MTAIYPVTFVMHAVLICKWTLSHYDGDDDDDDDTFSVAVTNVRLDNHVMYLPLIFYSED